MKFDTEVDARAFLDALEDTYASLASSAAAETRRVADVAAQGAGSNAPVDEDVLRPGIRVEGPFADAAGVYSDVLAPGHWRYNEFGTINQRPRPFMRPAIRRAVATLGTGIVVRQSRKRVTRGRDIAARRNVRRR